jgi:hypothetical protein
MATKTTLTKAQLDGLMALGYTKEQIAQMILGANTQTPITATAPAAPAPVESTFLTQVKAQRAAFIQAKAIAKANKEDLPKPPKAFEQNGFSVSLVSGWITSKLGFNGDLASAEQLLQVLPTYIAALKQNPQYQELARFLAK